LQRDTGAVRNDVARKLVSAAAARNEYGVVLSGDDITVDARATEDARASMRASRATQPLFDFGERPSGVRAS